MPSISTRSEPLFNREFLGLGQLRLVAALDEVAHDVEILHLLAGGEFRAWRRRPGVLESRRRRASVRRRLTSRRRVDQKLQVDDRGDHAQETLVRIAPEN